MASSRLCLACGLCCRGLLHRVARLRTDELPAARELGLTVVEAPGGGSGFSLPCPRLVDDACTVYERRPTACRAYRCHLLQRLETGELGLEPALAVVRRAHRLIERLEERLGAAAGALSLWDRVERWLGGSPPVAAAARLDAGELLALCRREFKPRREDPAS